MKQGWEIKKLDEICEVEYGTRVVNKRDSGTIYPVYGGGGATFSIDEFNREDCMVIARFAISLKCTRFVNGKFFLNDSGLTIKPLKSLELNQKFLDFQILFLNDIIYSIARGTAQKNLDVSAFRNLEIKYPKSLEIQKQIVTILDKAFATIDQAKTNAQKNLQNAKELFESSLQIIFTNKGKGWEEKNMEDICEISSKLIDPKLKEYQNLIHIGAGNIESKKGTLIELKTAKEENLISGKFLFDKTMVLYSKIRPYLIKVVKCNFEGLCSADIYPLVPLKNVMTKNFLYYLLITKDFTDYAIKGSQRAGMPKVNRNHLFAYKLHIPPLTEQQIIVSKLDALQVETKKLEAIYTQKIADLDELKKSILQKAFAGELSIETANKQTATTKVSVTKPKTKIVSINPTDLQAGIVSIALQRHQQKNQTHTFHHIKAEKIVHLAQSILCLELERVPCKDAAGPNDFPHSKKVESRAKKAGFYTVHKKADFYEYSEGTQMQKLIDKTYLALDEKAVKLNNLIDMIVPMTTQQAEIFATVYAGWNNLLLDNKPFTDEDIVTESRENWHKQKLNIEREKFFKAITWMREKNIIPAGIGNKVSTKIPVKK